MVGMAADAIGRAPPPFDSGTGIYMITKHFFKTLLLFTGMIILGLIIVFLAKQ